MPYLSRLDRQIERFSFDVKAVGLDAGYNTTAICKGLQDRKIFGAIAYKSNVKVKDKFAKRHFHYDESMDCYLCPNNCILKYANTSREGYKIYKSNPKICVSCPHLTQCTSNAKYVKSITRHVWEHFSEQARENRLSDYGKRVYSRRKETIERSFADSKQLHGYRYARFRGLQKVREQSLFTAITQNIKKITLILTKEGGLLSYFTHILAFARKKLAVVQIIFA